MRAAEFRRFLAMAAAGACLSGGATAAWASGFALREGSTDWMANAFAGDTAKAYDASTAWSNPAGMVRLDQSEIDGSINGLFPSVDFSGANFVGPTATTKGTTGGNLGQSIATGGLYGVWSATPDFKIGFGVGSPFGERITNPDGFVGRYQSLVSSISDVELTISAAYKINEHWSIGGGPVIDFFSARLTQALNTPAAAYGDAIADVHGSDTAPGFNLGVLYQATPGLRFGLDYRSRIRHDITGTQSIFVPAVYGLLPGGGLLTAALNAQNSLASTSITLPDSLTGGAYWQVTPQLALLSDLSWTDWSLLRSLDITPTSPLATPTTLVENWHNTVAISLGANYNLTRTLMLQSGVGFDQSPVTDSNRTSRIPDSNRYLVSVGGQYEIMPNLTLQAAYSHVFFASAEIVSEASTTSGVLVGKYANSADTVSLGVKYRF